ncbi:MAG TPA: hypothetical protein VL326_32925 [Kofleriaceae bacterium]|nr:hypothetical protein [Kofleriaceae bacterium]
MDRRAWLVVLLLGCGKAKHHPPATGGSAGSGAPAALTAKLGRAIDVSVSQSHVCAVLASGEVACWGELDSSLGPLVTRPTLIKGVSGATAIADGLDCVLRGAKPAMCWDNDLAVKEMSGTEGARQLVHGEWAACFVLTNGSVACWDDRTRKLAPEPGLSDVRFLDRWAYNEWCYVRDKDGQIVCTGEHANDLGPQLPAFADAVGVSRVAQSVACVFRKGGAISCFGTYADEIARLPARGDQLYDVGTLACVRAGDAVSCRPWGAETWDGRALPGGAKVTSLSCEANTCCTVQTDGAIACWGDNQDGRLGDGVPAHAATPTKVDILPPVATVVAGERFNLAITREGDIYAWGGFGKGPHVPSKIENGPVVSLATSGAAVIVARESSIRVMGSDADGWESESLPTPPAKPRSVAVDDAGNFCAALDDEMTYCLREDAGSGDPRWMPIRGMKNATQLSGGGATICGLVDAGAVACMLDERAEDETKGPPRNAVIVPGITKARRLALPYVELADGIVLMSLDESRHWTVKHQRELAGFAGISTGGYDWSPTCAIKDKRASCWFAFGGGDDQRSVLARESGSNVPTGTPAPVAGSHDAVSVAAGNSHACLVDADGAVWCWGDDRYGTLGRGRVTWRDEPVRVVDIGP